MRSRIRQRALRIMWGSLIQSELSGREIREVADALHRYDFSAELAELLHDTVNRLRDVNIDKQFRHMNESSDDIAFALVQKRRLSKKNLLQLMSVVAADVAERVNPNATVREMLEQFSLYATGREQDALLANLDNSASDDAYLKGINRRE